MIVQHYGWRPSLPDHRDQIADTTGLPVLAEVDPRGKYMSPIYDQLRLGSCTANAVAAALDADLIVAGKPPVYPSRLGIYYCERVIEGQSVRADTGAFGRDGFKAARNDGVWHEKDWLYVGFEADPTKEPRFYTDPATALGAAPYKLTSPYRAVPRSITAFKRVLSNSQTIALGFTVYESFESAEVARTGIMPVPGQDEKVLGGHEILVVGYLKSEPHYALCRNSWGNWGVSGYFFMPWAVIMDRNMASDFRTIRRPA